jgi:hypothetical protein
MYDVMCETRSRATDRKGDTVLQKVEIRQKQMECRVPYGLKRRGHEEPLTGSHCIYCGQGRPEPAEQMLSSDVKSNECCLFTGTVDQQIDR